MNYAKQTMKDSPVLHDNKKIELTGAECIKQEGLEESVSGVVIVVNLAKEPEVISTEKLSYLRIHPAGNYAGWGLNE